MGAEDPVFVRLGGVASLLFGKPANRRPYERGAAHTSGRAGRKLVEQP